MNKLFEGNIKITWLIMLYISFMFQFCFMFYMEEGHFAVSKGEKTAMFYRLKYRHYFVIAV